MSTNRLLWFQVESLGLSLYHLTQGTVHCTLTGVSRGGSISPMISTSVLSTSPSGKRGNQDISKHSPPLTALQSHQEHSKTDHSAGREGFPPHELHPPSSPQHPTSLPGCAQPQYFTSMFIFPRETPSMSSWVFKLAGTLLTLGGLVWLSRALPTSLHYHIVTPYDIEVFLMLPTRFPWSAVLTGFHYWYRDNCGSPGPKKLQYSWYKWCTTHDEHH